MSNATAISVRYPMGQKVNALVQRYEHPNLVQWRLAGLEISGLFQAKLLSNRAFEYECEIAVAETCRKLRNELERCFNLPTIDNLVASSMRFGLDRITAF